MGELIGELLPFAVGVAVSPLPIVAVVLMLLSANPAGTSFGFLLGWICGMIVVTALFAWLVTVTGLSGSDEPSPAVSWIKLVLGISMIGLAVKQWMGRPKPGTSAPLPAWMAALDRFTVVKAGGLGFALSAVNPKNLMMCAAAGVLLAGSGTVVGDQVIAGAVFVLLAAVTVAVPVIAFAVARDAMRGWLKRLKSWLQAENATVMAVLLLVIGVVLVGKGVGGLF